MENYNELIFSAMIAFAFPCFRGWVLAPSTKTAHNRLIMSCFLFLLRAKMEAKHLFFKLFFIVLYPISSLLLKIGKYIRANSAKPNKAISTIKQYYIIKNNLIKL